MSKLTLNEVRGVGETTYKSVPRGLASAWANLNGTGTIALRDSENVSSVVDVGTGEYAFNFSNDMANTNYNAVSNGGNAGGIRITSFPGGIAPTASGYRVYGGRPTTTDAEDLTYINSTVQGDLA